MIMCDECGQYFDEGDKILICNDCKAFIHEDCKDDHVISHGITFKEAIFVEEEDDIEII